MFQFREKGAILLIVVLAVIVVSTVGLSVISRSITSLRSSTEDIESQKASAAAEAGIERATQSDTSVTAIISGSLSNNATFETEITPLRGNEFKVYGGNIITQGEGADIWLSGYAEDSSVYSNPWSGSLSIYWGEESTTACSNASTAPAALEIIIILGPKANPTSRKYAYDPCSARSNENKFTLVSLGSGRNIDGKDFLYGVNIPNFSQGLIMRIVPIYKNTTAGIWVPPPGSPLPLQGAVFKSTGKSNLATHKLVTFEGYPQLPNFQYGLFVPD